MDRCWVVVVFTALFSVLFRCFVLNNPYFILDISKYRSSIQVQTLYSTYVQVLGIKLLAFNCCSAIFAKKND